MSTISAGSVSKAGGKSPGSVFFHSVSDPVRLALLSRQTALSAVDRGSKGGLTPALKWGYAKEAFCNVYWHCPSGKKADILICGSDFAATKTRFSPRTPGASKEGSLYKPAGADDDGRYLPPKLLESVSITNEGRVGSLQKITVDIKCFTMADLTLLEKQILYPGADVKVVYGWNTSVDPNPNHTSGDFFVGIIHNFGWSMNSDLSISVNFQAVGKGFAINSVTSKGINEENEEFVEDENQNKIFADDFNSKLKADVESLKSTATSPGFYPAETGGYKMIYGVQKFKYDPSNDVKELKEGEKETPPDEQVVFYVKLNDVLEYYNKVVIGKIGRISDGDKEFQMKFSANYGIDVGGTNGEQEQKVDTQANQCFFPVSVSTFVPDLVSSDPGSILFNDNACYMKTIVDSGDPASGFWKIEDGGGENEWAKWSKGSTDDSPNCESTFGVNLGEVLIGVNFLSEVLEKLQTNGKDPISKSVQALGNEIFKKINECSGGLYKLTWSDININEGSKGSKTKNPETWVCVVDPNFTVCDPIPFLFHVDKPGKSLVKKASLSSKIPSGQQTALYVGGRSTGATDGQFTSAAKVTTGTKGDAALCSIVEVPKNTGTIMATQIAAPANGAKKSEIPSIEEAREAMGKYGCTALTRANLKASLSKYLMKQMKESAAAGKGDRYSFMRRDMYPLECDIELEGIAGFRFGDAVMINYVPERYRGNLCFIVTKSEHRISKNNWTTNLKLQARTHNDTTEITAGFNGSYGTII